MAGHALELLGVLPRQGTLAVTVADHAVRHPQRQGEHLDLQDVSRLGTAYGDRAGDHVGAGSVVDGVASDRDRVAEHLVALHAVLLEEGTRVLALVLEESLVGDGVEGDDVAGAHHGDRLGGAVRQLAPQHLARPGAHVAAAGRTGAGLQHAHGSALRAGRRRARSTLRPERGGGAEGADGRRLEHGAPTHRGDEAYGGLHGADGRLG